MDVSSDPYELKLLQMFQSCDTEHCGLLNESALQRLCELLELNDKGNVLIASLADDPLKLRVSFDRFKEALLNFLGTELDGGNLDAKNVAAEVDTRNTERVLIISDDVDNYIDSPPDSSEREVSPKLILGAKKYGRRSRPQTNELGNFSTSDSEPEIAEEALQTEGCDNKLVQRCSSQTDITNSRRRRPPAFAGSKLKRCSSLPAQRNSQYSSKSLTMNRSAQTTLNASIVTSRKKQPITSSAESLDTPDVLETLPACSLIDIWERANIVNGRGILLALGFDEGEVNLVQLNKVLEEEVRSGDEAPPLALLRALTALQSHELAALRQNFRQLNDENSKLRSDNKEVNRRAAMLALEIDERHATIEDTTKEEIRKLEQRHAGVLRDLTARMTNDRENWSNLNARLEAQMKSFEREEIRLKTDLELVRKENCELEAEVHKLQRQITELLEKNILLNREIAEGEDNTRSEDCTTHEKKNAEDELLHLIEKISNLQTENKSLRDKNDELVAEVENLNFELNRAKSKNKKSSPPSDMEKEDSEQCGTTLTATKRRGDSPSKVRVSEESPRLGKLRKYTEGQESDSSGEWLALNSELKSSPDEVSEELAALKQRIANLEQQLKDTGQPDDRLAELEASLEQMQRAYEDCEDYWQGKLAEERQLFEKERQIYEDEQQESDKKFTELMEKVREYEEQFSKDGRLSPIEEQDNLEQQYTELEAETEEIRKNANKIFAEKTREIEALHAEIDDLRQRLGESVEILTGASELKSEAVAAAAAQRSTQNPQSPASSPISYLWHQSTIQEPAKGASLSLVSLSSPSKQASRNNLTTSETAIFSTTSADTISLSSTVSPIQKPGKCKTLKSDCGEVADYDTSSTTSGKSFETHSVTSTAGVQVQQNGSSREQSNASPSPSCSKIKEELKRLKFFELSLKDQIKDLSLQRDGLVMELQQLQEARPVLEKAYARTKHPTLIQRVSQLELKNRHLQNVIKQQQLYTESLMQQSWRQHQMELSDLHNKIEGQGAMIAEQTQRLQNADLLVKDLYVENSHLTVTVQRLEEQQRVRAAFVHQQRQPLPMLNLPGMP